MERSRDSGNCWEKDLEPEARDATGEHGCLPSASRTPALLPEPERGRAPRPARRGTRSQQGEGIPEPELPRLPGAARRRERCGIGQALQASPENLSPGLSHPCLRLPLQA